MTTRTRLTLTMTLGVTLCACAGARPSSYAAMKPCDEAWTHVRALLEEGLQGYLEGMRSYAAARDPELTMEGTSGRTRERAKAWELAHAKDFASECRAFTEVRLQCVLWAAGAPGLGECGLEPLVRSFTDEVLTEFASRPFDRS